MSENELNSIIARNISSYLERTNSTQAELGEYLDVSQATVSHWCTGDKTPRMNKLDKICEFFGIERSALFEDTSSACSKPDVLSDDEKLVIKRYRLLTLDRKADIKKLMDLYISESSTGKSALG